MIQKCDNVSSTYAELCIVVLWPAIIWSFAPIRTKIRSTGDILKPSAPKENLKRVRKSVSLLSEKTVM